MQASKRNTIFKQGMFCLLFQCLVVFAHAQTKSIDNLREIFIKTTSVNTKEKIILDMCEQYYSLSADSLIKYINLGKKYFEPGSNEYLRLQTFYCIYLYKIGDFHEGMMFSDSLVESHPLGKNAGPVIMEMTGSHANGLIRNGENKAAIELAFNLLQEAERSADTLSVMKSYTSLGWANMELNQFSDAVRWLNKGIHYSSSPGMLAKNHYLFSNIASSYNNLGSYDSAYYFINKALKYEYELENLTGIANSLNIRADIFINQKNYIAAESDMKNALDVRKKIGDMLYVTADMAQLSAFYASVNLTDKGIDIAKEGIEIAKKRSTLNRQLFLYSSLAENYRKSNQLLQYGNTLETIIKLKDSLYKKNSDDAIAEMEVKYELQKQQNIIMRQEYALTRSRYLIAGSAMAFVLGLLLAWVLYRNYKLSQKRKMEFAVAEQKLLSFKAVEMAKENERKRIAADLHDNLGSYAAAITANVKSLRANINAGDDVILEQLDANAQSMVTQLGDTIWVLKNEHLPFTGLADRFKLWVLRLMKNYPQVKYHYGENIEDDIEFTPARILNIFLMLKECVNNAVKHSSCTELRIFFQSKNGSWYISIEDNGNGFQNANISKGSGIDNIRNRAKESGWKVEWENVITGGTRVVISDKP